MKPKINLDMRSEWKEARREMRGRFLGHEHWLVVFDRVGIDLINRILAEHYDELKPEDTSFCATVCSDGYFAVLALPKRLMLAHEYLEILETIGMKITERDVAERDCVFAVEDRSMAAAIGFGRFLFGDLIDVPMPETTFIQRARFEEWKCFWPGGR